MDSGRIDQMERQVADPHIALDQVARRTGDVCYDGFVFFQQGVEQRRFAYVGAADDDGVNTPADKHRLLRRLNDRLEPAVPRSHFRQ